MGLIHFVFFSCQLINQIILSHCIERKRDARARTKAWASNVRDGEGSKQGSKQMAKKESHAEIRCFLEKKRPRLWVRTKRFPWLAPCESFYSLGARMSDTSMEKAWHGRNGILFVARERHMDSRREYVCGACYNIHFSGGNIWIVLSVKMGVNRKIHTWDIFTSSSASMETSSWMMIPIFRLLDEESGISHPWASRIPGAN